jgi:hypothetical protein
MVPASGTIATDAVSISDALRPGAPFAPPAKGVTGRRVVQSDWSLGPAFLRRLRGVALVRAWRSVEHLGQWAESLFWPGAALNFQPLAKAIFAQLNSQESA